MLAVLVTIATCAASCASEREQPPGMNLASMQSMQMSVAPAGSCQIDAVKMCQAEGSSTTPSSQPATTSSYGPPNMPESIDFQIPAGQTIKLMCYYDPQHSSIYRADATAQSPLTGNSVEYMRNQGFCVTK
jgi:uncharacterized protein involved in copper resistance